jgi:hypothetical protein
MLEPQELQQLRELFFAVFDLGEFALLLRDLGKPLPISNDYEEIISLALDKANRRRWLAKLVERAIEKNCEFRDGFAAAMGECPKLAALQQVRPAAPQEAAPSVFDTYFFKRRPFVNRGRLRRSLRSLHEDGDDAARILIVRGDRYSGKSYTVDLIRYLSDQLDFRVQRVELLKLSAGRELTPEILGRAVIEEMKLAEPMPEVEHDQVAWWTTHYLSWLVRNLRDAGDSWWIVVDDFTQVSVSRAVQEFIEEMALKIDDSLSSLRLILVGFDHDLPEKLEPIIEVDQTEPITAGHLVDYFAQFLRDHVPAVDAGAAPRVIADAVKTVRDEMSKREPRNRLVGMMAAIVRESRRLREEGP